MCGIVGYIGKKNAVPFLLSGLEKLEYRGYDSSGIAIVKSGEMELIKKQGRLKVIRDIIENKPEFSSSLGIGHTRWATHGVPSDINAHPHVSSSGLIALVHNGIIENYIEIKEKLIQKGVKFASDTDTEVIAQLIESLYDGDIFAAVKKTVNILEGSFALGIICKNHPDTLIAVNKDSPLIIGVGDGENYIASDIPAVLSKTRTICRLPEKQIAVIKYNDFELYDFNGNKTEKNLKTIDWKLDSAEKNGYEHFMMKEIMEQPKVMEDTISPRISDMKIKLDNIDFSQEYLNSLNKVCIVACGSAYHVGCAAKYLMEKLIKKTVEVDLASEFRYRNPIVDKNTLVIIISQSGETADSIAALREAKSKGARILSVVNVVGSTIASESNDVLYTHAGPEIAVATTKAYSTQLALMYILSLHLAQKLGKVSDEEFELILENIKSLPNKIQEVLKEKETIQNLAGKYHKYEKVFFIGRNFDYAVCMEGSLKLKEISYVHSEAYGAGELKHGTISLIDNKTLVIALATQPSLVDKMISNIREVKSRGAKILSLTSTLYQSKLAQVSDDLITIPDINSNVISSLAVIPLQIFSYYVAKLRGCDIDKPRNLAKSVTVE